MAVPVSGMTPARRERNGNKHKRLFLGGPGGLTVSLPCRPSLSRSWHISEVSASFDVSELAFFCHWGMTRACLAGPHCIQQVV